jgi:preprotein translocase subunit SecF
MEFFHKVPHINFLAARKVALAASTVVFLAACISLATRGLNLGLDFTGGVVVEIGFPKVPDLNALRKLVTVSGFPHADVSRFGHHPVVLIRLRPRHKTVGKQVAATLARTVVAHYPGSRVVSEELIGPQVGSALREKGITAMVATLVLILLYVAFRFEWRFAVGAIAATIHDVVFTIGFFSFTGIGFNLNVLAAILAIMGYSLNDTVVVFDRIREDFRKYRRGTPLELMNIAINETLSRTLMTSFMTLLVVIALLLVGGPVLRGFSIALFVGILVGTYSSIFIASATALMLGVDRSDLLPRRREDLADGRP